MGNEYTKPPVVPHWNTLDSIMEGISNLGQAWQGRMDGTRVDNFKGVRFPPREDIKRMPSEAVIKLRADLQNVLRTATPAEQNTREYRQASAALNAAEQYYQSEQRYNRQQNQKAKDQSFFPQAVAEKEKVEDVADKHPGEKWVQDVNDLIKTGVATQEAVSSLIRRLKDNPSWYHDVRGVPEALAALTQEVKRKEREGSLR